MPLKKEKLESKHKLWKYFFVLAFFLVVLFGYLFYKSQKVQKVELGLTWIDQAQFAGIYTAIEEGFYEDVGLDVHIAEFKDNIVLLERLEDGELDFTVSQPINLIQERAIGRKVKAVAAVYQISPLAFLHDKDKKFNNPNDFKDITFGYRGSDVSPALYSLLLQEFGLKRDDVEFKSLDFATHQIDDIQNDVVDVTTLYRTDQVYLFEKNNIPYEMLLPEDFGMDMYGDVLVTTDKLVAENPKLVQKFVDATLKGWRYSLENKDVAVKHTMKYITNQSYLDPEYNEFILEESEKLIDPLGTQKIGDMSPKKWTALYEIMLSSGLLEYEFAIEDIFSLEFIDK